MVKLFLKKIKFFIKFFAENLLISKYDDITAKDKKTVSDIKYD